MDASNKLVFVSGQHFQPIVMKHYLIGLICKLRRKLTVVTIVPESEGKVKILADFEILGPCNIIFA